MAPRLETVGFYKSHIQRARIGKRHRQSLTVCAITISASPDNPSRQRADNPAQTKNSRKKAQRTQKKDDRKFNRGPTESPKRRSQADEPRKPLRELALRLFFFCVFCAFLRLFLLLRALSIPFRCACFLRPVFPQHFYKHLQN